MKIVSFLKRNAPTILTITASIGVPLSSYLTAKAALKADKIMTDIPDEQLKTLDTQKKLIQVYIPSFISNALTVSTIVACHLMNKKIQAGLIAAYSVLHTTFEAYKSKLTVEEETMIEKDVDKDRIYAEIDKLLRERPDEQYELWIDDYRKKPYWARKSDILLGKDAMNNDLGGSNFARNLGTTSLEVFYSHVKGDPEPQDYIFGWDIDYLVEECEEYDLDVDWTDSDIYTDPDTGISIPCNHIYWNVEPIMNYWNYKSIYDKD